MSDWMFLSTQFTMLFVQFLAMPLLLFSILVDEFIAHRGSRRNHRHAPRRATVVALPARA